MNTNKNSPRLQKTRVLKPHLNKKHHILSSTNINIFTTPHNISYPNRSFFYRKSPQQDRFLPFSPTKVSMRTTRIRAEKPRMDDKIKRE